MKWYQSLLSLAVLAVGCSALITEAEIQEQTAKGLRLISLEEGVDPVWKTEDEVLDLIREDIGFFDVTEYYDPNDAETISLHSVEEQTYDAPAHIAHVQTLLADVSIPTMQQYLSNLTAFNNRYYRAQTGVQATNWIRDTMQAVVRSYPTSGATVSLFTHSFIQSSIIGRIPGSNPSAPRVIIGAHMDSINSANPMNGRAPGADDDGSGTVNVMEAFRVLVASGFKPTATVEFHLYAGEEAGLLGSQAVARNYKSSGIQVRGMLNLDMTAYVRPGTTAVVGLLPDNTNAALTRTIQTLIDTYLSVPWVTSRACGYACSDHASWNREGFPSAAALEGDMANLNSRLHTVNDLVTLQGFSWTHTAEFAKLAVAFATELGA
ncbi:aminopeptidase [Coprinopsis cinerea okayama7|uniref:Peptide hydrolase n=1 Tax=Coprinopsis cinerea (strain Okayama-7 / 130 / ATCC MYA-4618 / FGSC 9003) TaxID=240176 RepID=A8NAG7_COPC7|nr:aminopeptidase [Coprinopsis cinerea okayama7\|eukprot:XP_001831819.1 aminopeptidase [Coprinopsis cinerea okayama7\